MLNFLMLNPFFGGSEPEQIPSPVTMVRKFHSETTLRGGSAFEQTVRLNYIVSLCRIVHMFFPPPKTALSATHYGAGSAGGRDFPLGAGQPADLVEDAMQ
eukprot:symbB.v1.2.003525.t1/scaffold201.1/size272743/17